MRSVLSAILLSSAVVACGGTTNNTTVETTPNANGVFPSSGFQGNNLRVEITGDATDWSASTTVSFGAGVTVNSLSVASADDLIAEISIDGGATPGMNDVTITDGGGGSDGALTLKSAFEIDSPEALSLIGDATQGGAPFFTIQNLDILNPFDATVDANGNFVNTGFMIGTGIGVSGLAISDNLITGRLLIDTSAQPSDFVLERLIGSDMVSVDLGSIAVTTNTPMDISGGSDFTVDIAAPGDTVLLSTTAVKESFEEIGPDTVLGSDAPATASAFLEGLTGGSWATPFTLPLIAGSGETDIYVLGDQGEVGGYHITVELVQTAIKTHTAEGSDTLDNASATTTNILNDASGGATTVLPDVFTGTLSSVTDVDFIKLTNVPNGKTIRVTDSVSSDQLLDAAIDIQDATGTSINQGPVDSACGFFGPPCNNVDTSATASSATPTATYFIEVEPGALFDPTHAAYTLFISIQ